MQSNSRTSSHHRYHHSFIILTTNSNYTSSLRPIPGTTGVASLPKYLFNTHRTLNWGTGFGQVAECLPRPVPIKPLPSNPYPPPVRVDVTCDEAQVGRLEGFPALAVSGVI